jgi:hypothetical protein
MEENKKEKGIPVFIISIAEYPRSRPNPVTTPHKTTDMTTSHLSTIHQKI